MASNFEGGGLVSDIISPQVYKQIADLIADLSSANDAIARIAATSKVVELQFKGADSLASLNATIKEGIALINGLDAAQKAFSNSNSGLDKMASQYGSLKSNIDAATTAIKSNDQELTRSIQAQINEIEKKNLRIAKSFIDEINAESAAEQKKESIRAASEQKAIDRAARERQRQEQLGERLAAAYDAEAARIEAAKAKEIAAFEKAQQAYVKLNREALAATKEYQNLAAQEYNIKQGTDPETKAQQLAALAPTLEAAKNKATELNSALLKIDQTVGISRRNVGNYNSATMAMSQILREAPSFAYSFSTGLLGISNNIPILVDEITKLNAVNKDLIASGGKAIPVWKTLSSALTSPVGIITILTAAVTIFSARMAMAKNATSELTDTLGDYKKTLDSIEKSSFTGAEKEAERLKLIAGVAQDTTKSMQVRLSAVQELQKQFPSYFSDLSKEAILNGDVTKQVNLATEAIYRKATATAAMDKFAEASKREYDLMKLQEKATLDYIEVKKKFGKIAEEEEAKFKKGDEADFGPSRMIGNAKRALTEITAQRMAVRAEMQGFLDDAKKADLGFTIPDKDKGGKGFDDTRYASQLTGLNDLTEAQYEAAKKGIQIDQEYNKAVSESNLYSIEVRKDALRSYYEDTLELAKLSMNKEIAINDNIIVENKRKLEDKTKITKDEYANTLKVIEAAEIRNKTITDEYNRQAEQALRTFGADNIRIIKSDVEQKNNVVKQEAEQEIETRSEVYAKDLRNLVAAYQQKKLTTEQYNKQLIETQNKFNEDVLKIEIEKDTKELSNLQEGSVEYVRILEDRTKKEIQLINATADTAKKAKKDPFEGDLLGAAAFSLTKNLSPDATEDEQIKAAKKVKELTVQLAQETANAIIQIEENKFKKIQEDLDRQGQQIEINKSREIDAVNATADYADNKAAKIKEINAKAAAQENELAEKKKEENIKAARFEKAANIARILSSTAVAEVQALSYLSNPATAAIYPVIAGLIGAIGAAQLAAAASAPLPAYRHGTDYHKGGLAIVGDGGERELISEPNKAPYWSGSKSEVRNLAKGTKVTPESQLMRYAEANINNYIFAGTDAPMSGKENDYSHVFRKGLKGMEQVVGSIKPHVTVIVQNNDIYNKLKYE